MNKSIKNIFIGLIEYSIVFFILLFICFKINEGIVIKGLFMDDLLDWSWYRGSSWYDFAIKFYSKDRYRPVFETTQYILYGLVGTDPMKFTFYNKIYNAIISFFIYHFVKKLDAGRIISLTTAAFYLIAHYAYYQIGQGIASLESDSLFLTLLVIYFCLKLTGAIKDKDINGEPKDRKVSANIINLLCIFVFYFLVVFAHERFIGLLLPIFVAILYMKRPDGDIYSEENAEGNHRFLKLKIISLLSFIVELGLIVYLRHIAIGRILPAGTGGTYVEETFKIDEFLSYALSQVAIIFGINIGPEHLVGIDFDSITNMKIKRFTYLSIVLVIKVIFSYIIKRIILLNKSSKKKAASCLSADLIFLTAIMMCIASTSVTIRVEMRFVYSSFTLALIYVVYMCSYLISGIKNVVFRFSTILTFILIFAFRFPIEVAYRSHFDKIHCYVDTKRMNSLYDQTIGTYGLDEILHKKKVYIINQYFGMTKFYSEYYYKIYDINDVGTTINLVNSYEEIPAEDINEDTIILVEDWKNNVYEVYEKA